MKLKNIIIFLIFGALLILAGLNLILDFEGAKNIGVFIALTGVLTDIVMLILIIKQEKWLAEFDRLERL